MEINIHNAFKVAVELSCRPYATKYRKFTEKIQKSCFQLITFFLERPLLTTLLFSTFTIILIIVLSVAFMILMGVFIFVFIIILIEGFAFTIVVTVISVIICTATLLAIIVVEIMYAVSNNDT